MATSDKLPSNAAIWSGRKLATPKVLKVKVTKPKLGKRHPRVRGKRK